MTLSIPLLADATDHAPQSSIHALATAVVRSKRILIVTGAGISCSSGIPDFRSKDGLYNLVKEKYPDTVLKGRDLFDSSLFREATSTAVFYTFISQLRASVNQAKPSPTHHFIKTLDTKGKLLRSYTQNIDGFEERLGLTSRCKGKAKSKEIRNVLLHGDIHRVRCQLCNWEAPCSTLDVSSFDDGVAPDCPECVTRSESRVASSRRALKIGKLRPAIVLYDEPHPNGDLIGTIQAADAAKRPDLLIIMGTSLKVYGLKRLVKDFAQVVHASTSKNGLGGGKVIYVNLTEPAGSEWGDVIDYHVNGTTDDFAHFVESHWRKIRPSDWEIQTTLTDSPNGLKVVKETVKPAKPAKKAISEDKENHPPPVIQAKPTPEDKENCPPTMQAQIVPLSPSKRRSKASHYDVPLSPSKKKSRPALESPNVADRPILTDTDVFL